MTVLIQVFSGIGHLQRYQIHHFGYRHPLVIKVLVLHSILQTVFFQMFYCFAGLGFVPTADIAQLGSLKRNFDEQSLHQRTLYLEKFLMLLIVIGQFRFRNFLGKGLIHQCLLIGMHNQRFPVVLHQLVNLTTVGNIAFRLLIQQHFFRPVAYVMLCKQQAVILRQPRRKYRLQIFMVKEVAIQFH